MESKSLKIDRNEKGNDWVITDIHGCSKTLKKLLDKLELSSEDRLIFLGDLVNKGPNNFGVLNTLMDLSNSGVKQIKLWGNHDLLWLELVKGKLEKGEARIIKSKEDALTRPLADYVHFLENETLYFIESDKHFLVHAGFDFDSEDPFSNTRFMTETREVVYDSEVLKGKILIHGHIPNELPTILHAFEKQENILPLDNGCVYAGKREHMGNLMALNINRWIMRMQTCID